MEREKSGLASQPIYIGAESLITPLGATTAANWAALQANCSGISLVNAADSNGGSAYLSKIAGLDAENKFLELLTRIISEVTGQVNASVLASARTIVVISSTKGALDVNIEDPFNSAVAIFRARFSLANQPLLISNACISGVMSVNVAANLLLAGEYDHAVVIGCDVISDFVVNGFQSLFAMSDKPCAPFDADRNGISLGEGCGAVVLSTQSETFNNTPLRLLPGASANDANHISGPSRTGEGLFRSIQKTLNRHMLAPDSIDLICAHGTATVFNDEMESIAFDRAGLADVPVNSLKGYFGHTLGAAGVIETAVCMQMLRNQFSLRSLGFKKPGTSKGLNVVQENHPATLKTILKTASGFGGGNAALLLAQL